MLLFTHHSSLIDERGSSAVSSKSLGGTVNSNINVDLVRETRATPYHPNHPNCPKIGQIRSATSLNNMPFNPQMYCNVQIFTYEVA